MTVTLRPFTQADARLLQSLFEDFQDELVQLDPVHQLRREPNYGILYYKEVCANLEKYAGAMYVAVDDSGSIVGLSAGYVKRTTPDEEREMLPAVVGRITEWYVRPQYRKQGIGKKLFDAIEEYLIQQGSTVLTLGVLITNTLARTFYEQRGFSARYIDMARVVK